MSTDIETTTDTNNVADVAKNVALEVSKELATTAAGCVMALVLTKSATILVTKVRVHRADRKLAKADKVATAI